MDEVSPRSAFAIQVALAEGLLAEWRVVQVQRGWCLEKLLRHILILMGKKHEKNCSYRDSYTALLPRRQMARLVNVAEQLMPGDHVILAHRHILLPNKTLHFAQNLVGESPKQVEGIIDAAEAQTEEMSESESPSQSQSQSQLPSPLPSQSTLKSKSKLKSKLKSKSKAKSEPFVVSVVWPLTCNKVVAVSCASAHTMLATETGELFGYGLAENGRLGRSFGNTFNHLQTAPCRVDLPPGVSAVHVACGDKFTAVACRQAEVGEEGAPNMQNKGPRLLYTFGAAGPWLGLGDCAEDVWQPELAYLSSRASITSVSCGAEHSLFCTSNGQVYSFGKGDKGQLGHVHGPTGTLSAMSRFYFLTQEDLNSVWKEDQEKYVGLLIGGDEYDRLMHASQSEQKVEEGVELRRIGTFLQKPVQLFRQSSSGLTGLQNENGESLEVTKSKELRRGERRAAFEKAAEGRAHDDSMSSNTEIKDSEDVYPPSLHTHASEKLEWIFVLPCFDPVAKPRPVAALSGTRISSVAAGGRHSAALTRTGKLFTFGDNAFGQLGHGIKLAHMTGYTTPVATEVKESKTLAEVGVEAVACGTNHTAAVSKDGRLYMWGEGSQNADIEDLDCFRPNLLDTVSPYPITGVDAANNVTVCCDRAGNVVVVSPASEEEDVIPSWASPSSVSTSAEKILTPHRSLDILPTESVDHVLRVAVAGGGPSEPISGVLLSASYMDETLSAHCADRKNALLKKESRPKPTREFCTGIGTASNCVVC